MIDPLPADQLRWTCEIDDVRELANLPADSFQAHGVVGQQRALDAIQLGIDIPSSGYHIFVTGLVASGRTYTIQSILSRVASRRTDLIDQCYVHNFIDASAPRLITLPGGMGRKLRREMHELVEEVSDAVSSLFEDQKLREARAKIASRFQEGEQARFAEFEQRLNDAGLTPVTVQKGPFTISDVFPMIDEKPVPWDQFDGNEELEKKLPEDEREKLHETARGFLAELQTLIKAARRSSREMVEEVRKLEKSQVSHTLDGLIASVLDEFPENRGLERWLAEVKAHMLDTLDTFKRDSEGGGGDDDDDSILHLPSPSANKPSRPADAMRPEGRWPVGHPHRVYEVNVLHDSSDDDNPPIVSERNPTFTNLFGSIERDLRGDGSISTDFMHIRGGSMVSADGGFIVMYCRDVLLEPGVWRTLVRTLKSGKLEIHTPDFGLLGPSSLKPEPIPLDVKVILIGDERYYRLLEYYEEDFPKIFKIKAEFDTRIHRTDENVRGFMAAVTNICECEEMIPADDTAMAALIEEAVRRAGRRNRIYTRFGEVADLVRESAFAGQRKEQDCFTATDVRAAIEAQRRRHSLLDERLQDMLVEELLLVDTDGERIGQVNGLAVYSAGGPALFGKPSRISATVGPGASGIVNIEREARLSGSTHDKGVLILAGYLRHVFGQEQPLALSASLAFEQSYGGVDGDSATCAEYFALISSIAGAPLRQDIAITGSMNQFGDVQPIGGVNEKIEGFFRLCQERGLTGSQGCIIPLANVEDLMLHPDVVAAAEDGNFHIWPIRRVEDGLALLTRQPSADRSGTGRYNEDTVYRKAEDRLREWAKQRKDKAEGDTVRIEPPTGYPEPPSIPGDPTVPDPGTQV